MKIGSTTDPFTFVYVSKSGDLCISVRDLDYVVVRIGESSDGRTVSLYGKLIKYF